LLVGLLGSLEVSRLLCCVLFPNTECRGGAGLCFKLLCSLVLPEVCAALLTNTLPEVLGAVVSI